MITMLLGIVAGMIGVLETLLDVVSQQGYTPTANLDAYAAIVISALGIVISFFARRHPKTSGVLLYACGIGGFIFAKWSYIPPGIVFFIAATIAVFFDMREKTS
ncbi:hypothetical protein [Alicyclobacillus vulcanalis]|uniref:Uncharacterized protein n=1 Tax=Alicyclobacillus vulcanalis TaxID=252246 RepID=A0A1N7PTR1_9BACL|nr:hypothetical protein [Alicyclobacillus vulcanalis]SIT13966.1 hypothetical protein SAMN05421799_11719 [Alicyclobacillus vulcanalis]